MTPTQELEGKLTTFTSRGQLRYRCPACEFDSYLVANVIKHWSESHSQAQQRTLPGATLFDAKGNKVSSESIPIVVPDEEIMNQWILNQPGPPNEQSEQIERVEQPVTEEDKNLWSRYWRKDS